jgi:KDO2-lipid IV(A) lauroyltransferase
MPAWQSFPLRIALTVLGLLTSFLPRRIEVLFGPLLGRFALSIVRKRRRRAAENINRCLPELTDQQRSELLTKNCEHWGMIGFEFLHLFSPLPGHYRRYVEKNTVLHGFENWEKAHAKGKGTIIVGCHAGNWELSAAAGALQGMNFTIVTRRLTPDWLMDKIESSRLEADLHAVYQPRTVPTLMKELRKGHCVGFVIDQYAAPPMGVKARFFGFNVDTLAAVGPIAQRTGAAVVPTHNYRDANGIFHVSLDPELDFSTAQGDADKSTQILATMVETEVRQNPSQWIWGHRRFKNVDFTDHIPYTGN